MTTSAKLIVWPKAIFISIASVFAAIDMIAWIKRLFRKKPKGNTFSPEEAAAIESLFEGFDDCIAMSMGIRQDSLDKEGGGHVIWRPTPFKQESKD